MRSNFGSYVVLLSSALFLASCGGSSDPSARIHVSASAAAASELVGPGGVSLGIPAGASSEDVTIVLTVPNGRRPAPAGTTAVATPIRLGPEGQTFDKPLEVTIPISPSSVPAPFTIDDVVVVRAPQGSGSDAFVPLPTRRQGNAVICSTEHFSDFIPVVIDSANSPFGACGDDVCLPSESCDACPHDCGLCLPTADVTAPSVAMQLSPGQSTMVRGDSTVAVLFDEAVMPASVSAATVTLTNGGVPVQGTLLVQGSTVTFTPQVLLPNTTYDVRIAGVRDLVGNLMAAPYASQFTTDSSYGFVGANPASGTTNAPQNPFITFTFTGPVDGTVSMDPDDGPCTADVQMSADGFATCLGGGFTEGGSNDLVIVPKYPLPANSTVAIRFASTAVDPHGFSLGGLVGPYTLSIGPDTSPPRVLTMDPYNGAVDVPLDAVWTIDFDEPVSLAGATIDLTVGGTGSVFGSLAANGRRVTFTPMSPLAPNGLYNFLVSSVSDTVGNTMQVPATGSFATVKRPSILSSSPGNAAVGVHPRQDVVLTFSQPMNPSTLTMQAADGPCTGNIQLSNGSSCYGGAIIPTSTSATIQASTSLPFNTGMTLVFTPAVQDANGLGFAGGPVLTFIVSPVMDFGYAIRSTTDVTGALGGIVGADSLCDSQYPGTKAFLISSARYPCTMADCVGGGPAMDWVLSANTQYVNAQGQALFRTDATNPIFTLWPMTNMYSARNWNFLWGGTGTWTPSGLDCAGWTDGVTASMSVGYELSSTNGFINGGMLSCSGARPVLCVEQVPQSLPATH